MNNFSITEYNNTKIESSLKKTKSISTSGRHKALIKSEGKAKKVFRKKLNQFCCEKWGQATSNYYERLLEMLFLFSSRTWHLLSAKTTCFNAQVSQQTHLTYKPQREYGEEEEQRRYCTKDTFCSRLTYSVLKVLFCYKNINRNSPEINHWVPLSFNIPVEEINCSMIFQNYCNTEIIDCHC